jgi:hypothetical protein
MVRCIGRLKSIMRVYAHWLDGTYRQVSTGVTAQQPWSIEDQRAEAIIKTLALFGGSFVLSDVQVVDSPVLWKLFSLDAFQKYIRSNPDFLQLIGRPMTVRSDRRWAIATSGLERALKAGWIATPMTDDRAVLELSEALILAGPTGDLDHMLAERRNSPDLAALSGFTAVVRYFSSAASQVSEPPAERQQFTFYSVLELALESPDLNGIDRQHVEATLAMVNRSIEDPVDRIRRAAVLEHLDLTSPQHLSIWRTVVQAWNVAAQKSICETGGSIGCMPNSPPIGAYVDQVNNVMFTSPVKSVGVKQHLYQKMPEIPFEWDPADLSWADLLRISEDGRCADARSRLRMAHFQENHEGIIQGVQELGNAIAPLLKGRLKPPVGWWFWALGPVVLRFGLPEAPVLGVALFAGQLGQRSLVWAVNKARDRMIAAGVVESAKRIGLSRTQ